MYILPAIIFFQPELAKQALRYRSAMAIGAAENAKAMGSKGYKYPFRSAYTGREVSVLTTLNQVYFSFTHLGIKVLSCVHQKFFNKHNPEQTNGLLTAINVRVVLLN